MKNILYLSLIFLTACPSLQTRNEISTRQGRIDSIPRSGTNASNKPRASNIEVESMVEDENLREVVRRLNGAVEELSFKVSQIEASNQSSVMENRLNLIEQRLLSLGESIILLEQRLGTKTTSSQLATPPVAQSSAKASGPYERAENLFQRSNWKAAILEYNIYRDNFPKGRNYAEATYKIGVSFQELGMGSEAKSFYAEVIEKFPKTKTAKSAKYRLNQLKK